MQNYGDVNLDHIFQNGSKLSKSIEGAVFAAPLLCLQREEDIEE